MRPYEESHPWITFKIDLSNLSHKTWLLLGEAESKCQHVAGVPLGPAVAHHLHRVYLSKGIHGTAAIEGNTLSEEEVLARVKGQLSLPPSREYLGREIDNIVSACNKIVATVQEKGSQPLTVEGVCEFNRQVLDGLELEDDVVPGQVRKHEVGVLRYLGAPAGDCEFLLHKMCDWRMLHEPYVRSATPYPIYPDEVMLPIDLTKRL